MPTFITDFFAQLNETSLPLRFAVNLFALLTMTVGLYYRRYRRRDVLVVLIAFNVGLFSVLTVITDQQFSAGVGFGLFAILSIIRLRSEPISNVELSYFFMALALGLVNGFARSESGLLVLLNVALVATMFLVDLQLLNTTVHTRTIILASVETDSETLRQRFEKEFGQPCLAVSIKEIDYVRETTRVSMRYVADPVQDPVDSTEQSA